jgi:hypothetical protein
MTTPFSGGCACGAIRYECTAEPIMMFKCHCRDCQRATGGAFACAILLPADSFKFTRGTPRYHLSPSAAGGQHKRGFCAGCGSRLTGGENPEGTAGFLGINAGSLDDPGWFRPQMEIWTSDAQPWDHMDLKLPKFEQYPPRP